MPAAVSTVYNYLRNLLASPGPTATYRTATSQYKELEDIETKTSPDILGHPLTAALLRAVGIAPLVKSYNDLLRRSIMDFRPEFEQYARSVLSEPVQKYIFSDKPDFEKYVASIDDKTKDDLAGRYLAAILTSTPEHARAVVGGQAYNEPLGKKLIMDLTMQLYPGVADIAALELVKWYHEKYGPLVSQMSPDEIKSAVTSYVNMFDISPSDREKAIKRILADPARISVAVGVVSGGQSIDALKKSIADRFGGRQVRPTLEELITSPGAERFFRTSVRENRPVIAKLYTYPQIQSRPESPGLFRRIGEYIGILKSPVDISTENKAAIAREDLDELELVLGEVSASLYKLDEKADVLSPKEWDKVGEVLEHLHSKFSGRFPALSTRPPRLTTASGLYFPKKHKIETVDRPTTFFHELGHALNRPALVKGNVKEGIVGEIAAFALSLAVAAYAKGLDDHPLVQSAKRAGLLPGGSDIVKTPIDWAVEDVIPYILRIGPSHSWDGDSIINFYREEYSYRQPMALEQQSTLRTTPVIEILTKGFK